MNRNPWHASLMVGLLVAASILLTGCPKKVASPPDLASGSGAGGASGPGGGSTEGGSGSGLATLGAGGGVGGAGGPGAPSAVQVGGTTLPALPSPREFAETSALKDVHFDFDRYEIRTRDKPILDANARWLKANPRTLLLIEGHTDERGTNEYNLVLGERRAKAARDHLVSLGIEGSRISLISYGEERPACTERAEGCWAENRRAHFLVKQ